ncbi:MULTISPECIES: hypothetical protein [Alteribacter]|uniref:Uncharacterized protein n=1 Tax=Alteribacter keqinensis TaxID=2483800 RepID=A0A3M7TWE3_9BACI|nr:MULTISPECIES: hypothetical protein [Alteribacter]MBM7096075.1 hypothetical protein [Alteribacter salitolerans]RNA69886.1 hypothetical protein EBO34_08115 [Alteribacter keqinensis]
MNNSWTISELERTDDKLTVRVETDLDASALHTFQASGQMLADSDAKTFIYIIEDDSSFTYIRFPAGSWEALQSVRDDLPVVLELMAQNKEAVQLELTGFWTEIDYLVDNIEGNTNYGDEMMKAVEKAFNRNES